MSILLETISQMKESNVLANWSYTAAAETNQTKRNNW